jgi:hypothetical protein
VNYNANTSWGRSQVRLLLLNYHVELVKIKVMEIYILYNDFDYRVERASCDGKKLQEMADAYNGEDNLGPYCVISLELEDFENE